MTFHYGDPDNPWEDDDKAWRYPVNIPGKHQQVIAEAMDICRRTSRTFRTPAESKKWAVIVKRLDSGEIPEDWLEHCLDFAREKNRVSARAVPINFDTLTKYIRNKAAMTDWLAKNPNLDRRVPGQNDPYV